MIVETVTGSGSTRSSGPAVLVASHGPFAWGAGAEEAVENAIALEVVAESAFRTELLRPGRRADPARAAGAALPAQARPRRVLRPVTTYALGIDFGTESGRAVLVDCAEGRELGTTVYPYRHGVIDERLPAPHEDVVLEPDWALQDPEDYVRTLQEAVPALLAETGVDPAEVIGIGIDFTACTMLPTLADGTPLCVLDELRAEPHAWVKLWKHHAAQPEADRINEVAAARGETWLPRYGGKISSEWFFAKALQILDEAPEIYARAERLIEAADWIVWQLTGTETRNTCTAGYKAMWSKQRRFPGRRVLRRARPAVRARRRREDVADDLADREPRRRAERAGRRLDRPAPGHAGRGCERRRPRGRARGDGDASPGRWC